MNTANWIPDLFMERVIADEDWTLFSPDDTPDLHGLVGDAFKERYENYEDAVKEDLIFVTKSIKAKTLWRKMLSSLYETGHPWMTFKDPSNLRYTNQHKGVVHSSNLCVTGDTNILTSTGNKPIESLVGTSVDVWNGVEFSNTPIFKTSDKQPVLRVKLSGDIDIEATPYHKWKVLDGYSRTKIVTTGELIVGDKIVETNVSVPVVHGSDELLLPYECGFLAGGGTYHSKGSQIRDNLYFGEGVLKPKDFVPSNKYTIASRLKWLAGLFDADGTLTCNNGSESIQLASINSKFLHNVRNLLLELGVSSVINDGTGDLAEHACKKVQRIVIAGSELVKLLDLGYESNRVIPTHRDYQRSTFTHPVVRDVLDEGKAVATYCGTEPKRNMITLNGVLTMNCTEITLHSNKEEIAVCNLGSINLANHVDASGVDELHLQYTVGVAMRMLDNVIDYNMYPVDKAEHSNKQHRPVGLGIMGFQDALYKLGLPYDSQHAVEFADTSTEMVSYFAIQESTGLAVERGKYPSYEGSLWSQGILPIDSIERIRRSRKVGNLDQNTSSTMDWDRLRQLVVRNGMRNSNVMAIAPTATISNICGVSQSIEPTYRNIFVHSNLSGEFTNINPYLVSDLSALGLWTPEVIKELKRTNGSIQGMLFIPLSLRNKYKTAFEIEPIWLIEAASRRQKWIDMGQSLNLYVANPSGATLDRMYKTAWRKGLKTTYYLRTLGATSTTK